MQYQRITNGTHLVINKLHRTLERTFVGSQKR